MPILVVLFGLTFLLGAFGTFTPETVGMIWPILVIVGGIVKFFEHKCTCC